MLISYERARAESLGLHGQGRPHGARRAHGRARRRPHVRHPRPGAVDDARAHDLHRDPTVREGVAPGERHPDRASGGSGSSGTVAPTTTSSASRPATRVAASPRGGTPDGRPAVGARRSRPDPHPTRPAPHPALTPVPHPAYLAYRSAAALAQALPAPVAEPMRTGARSGRSPRDAGSATHDRAEPRAGHRRPTAGRRAPARRRARRSRRTAATGSSCSGFPSTSATRRRCEARFDTEGFDHIDRRRSKRGKGVVLALPHLGGCDFAGGWFAVAMGVRPPWSWRRSSRRSCSTGSCAYRRDAGMEVIALGPDAGPAVARTLRANSVVCLLAIATSPATASRSSSSASAPRCPAGPAIARAALRRTPASPWRCTSARAAATSRGSARRFPIEREGRLRDDIARITQAGRAPLRGVHPRPSRRTGT